jgi:NAD(P)-dependent dehydrogenase (short-subunit alcohol dehydrogenase family)
LFDLSGLVALVSGAASGLGRAIALGLDAFGARVILADRDAAGVAEVAAVLANSPLVVEVDVADPEQVAAMVDTALASCGRLDVGVLMPGTNVRKPALELSDAEWQRVVDLNLTAMFRCARAVGGVMVAQGRGSMILMASARGLTGGRRQAAYSASKAGVIGMMRCLAWEWAPQVRVNALAPGYMRTPLVQQIAGDAAWWQATVALHALGRAGRPEEVASVIAFLAGDDASFLVGETIEINGGQLMV